MDELRFSIENSNNEIQEFVVIEENNSINLLCLCSHNTVVEIPRIINNKPVTRIGHDCFFNHPEIKAILFPDTLLTIGDNAFALCKGLRELVLPDSITDIGAYAFRDCSGLKKVVMPANLKVLRMGLFSFCYFLDDDVEIILNEGLETIETKIFSGGGLGTYITLNVPKTVKSIAPGAFNYGMKIITSLPYDENWFA